MTGESNISRGIAAPASAQAGLRPEARYLMAATFVLAALMPAIPDQVSMSTLAFSCGFGAFAILSSLHRFAYRDRILQGEVALAIFFLSIMVSYPIAMSNGVRADVWIRGAIPFAFLSILLVLPRLSDGDERLLIGSIYVSCCAWAAKIFVTTVPEYLAGDAARLTTVSMDLQLPYDLIGFSLTLFVPFIRQRRVSWLFAAAFLFIIVATGYRSRALLAALVLLIRLVQLRTRWLAWVAASALAIIVLIGGSFISSSDSAFGSSYSRRFSELAAESGGARSAEIAYGLTTFAKSPLLGNGLQYPIPIAVTYYGRPDSDINDFGSTVGYLHNVWVYLLMDLGIVGLLAYTGCFVFAIWRGKRGQSRRFSALPALVILLSVLLLYCTVEAAFRLVQTNLVLGAVASVLMKRNWVATLE